MSGCPLAIGDRLNRILTARLLRHGLAPCFSANVAEMAAFAEADGVSINPQFFRAGRDGVFYGFYLVSANNRVEGMIAWEELEADNYVSQLVSGHEWMENPGRFEWAPIPFVNAPTISGNIHARGMLYTRKPGLALSWWLGGLHIAYALTKKADYLVSVAKRDIVRRRLPSRLYGYCNECTIPPHSAPWAPRRADGEGEQMDLTLVWSGAGELRDEALGRLECLRLCEGHDLATTASSHEMYKNAPKSASSVHRTESIHKTDALVS